MKRTVCGAVAAIATMLVGAPPATAAVTVGNNLATAPTGGTSCTGAVCTASQVSLPTDHTAPGGLFAPIDGVVVRWRISVGANTGPVALRITRPGNSTTRTGAGTGPPVTPLANTISEYEVQLPIRAGDAIGFDCCIGIFNASAPSATAARAIWGPRLEDGEFPRVASVQQGGSAVELLVNADIEPDCDADGLGDETQDPSVSPGGDCPKAVRAIALEADRTKVKKGKSVTLSGRLSAPGSEVACAGSQGVELQRKKPSQTVFTTVAQLQTTATGNFSATMKLKKTFEFRAEVVETAACTAALSNDEKVKVKKKK